ncbi:MAG: ABC transporter ATP-binding protein [Thermotogae bacterium]|nr:MAG: ABC transporter ATP-binding protein [Thermotogota bacterium]
MEIKVKDLSKGFRLREGQVQALNGITLTTPTNRILTLLGPSGCGKTTLLRCIAGLEVPDSGEIQIGETTVFSSASKVFVPPNKRGISMVFQSYAIWPHMTVFDNVAYPLQVQKRPKEEIKQRVQKTLALVQLEGFEHRSATKLSGGQQQRVALARALIAEPKVVLFDEPLSNLDAKLREQTRRELRNFLSELGISAVYVTHDRIEALTISDVVAVMKDGQIVEIGKPKELYFSARNKFVVDFIGGANFLEAKVVGYLNGLVQVRSPIGTIICEESAAPEPGRCVTVYIRPEAFEIIDSPSERKYNVFRGVVERVLFAGEWYESDIRVGNSVLSVRLLPSVSVAEGEEIILHAAPARCRIVMGPKERR